MCGEHKFFRCGVCGNFAGMLNYSGEKMLCCGKNMAELTPNTSDAAKEKHVPAVEISGGKVKVTVGEVLHPTLPEHYIEWVYIRTSAGGHRRCLRPGETPVTEVELADGEKVVAVYGLCNLHGLWKTQVCLSE